MLMKNIIGTLVLSIPWIMLMILGYKVGKGIERSEKDHREFMNFMCESRIESCKRGAKRASQRGDLDRVKDYERLEQDYKRLSS